MRVTIRYDGNAARDRPVSRPALAPLALTADGRAAAGLKTGGLPLNVEHLQYATLPHVLGVFFRRTLQTLRDNRPVGADDSRDDGSSLSQRGHASPT